MGHPDKGGGKGKSGKGKGKLPGKYAFKVLCPDSLILAIMGTRGSFKEQLESMTGCKILASNREEYFPGTRLRVLVIHGPNPDAVSKVLEVVIEKLVECGEQEMKEGPKAEPEFLGKDKGTYLFRSAISSRIVTSLIGPKGANVKAINSETNAKVSIDTNPHQGHNVLKITGAMGSLRSAVWRINEHAQMAADEPWFAEWALVRQVAEGAEAPAPSRQWEGQGERERSPRRGGAERNWDSSGWESGGKGGREGWSAGQDGHATGNYPPATDTSAATNDGAAGQDDRAEFDNLLQIIDNTSMEFPEGAIMEMFTITCDLPEDKVSALIGTGGEHVKHVRKTTGAQVVFKKEVTEGLQTMEIKGPLLSIYQAHALLMKRYHDSEPPPEPAASAPANPETVADLQAQLQQLQKQLAATTGKSGKGGKR